MPGRYAEASIAGVSLTDAATGRPCRVDVLDGEALKSALVGSVSVALDFTVHTQIVERGARSARFGLQVKMLSIEVLNAVVAAMEAALASGEDFVVTARDQTAGERADDINVRAVPDYAAMRGGLYTRGALSNLYVADVAFRFIATGAA